MKKIVTFLFMACIIFRLTLPVSAAQVPDLDREGSIRITLKVKDQPVEGGSLILYHLANLVKDGSGYRYDYVDAFSGCGEKLEDLESQELAERLKLYAKEQGMKGQEMKIDAHGFSRADGLKPGLYLISQEKASEGYLLIRPFLVSIPLSENGSYVYDVDASPKVEVKKSGDVPPDYPPNPPDNPPSHLNPPGDRLPQTGQNWWLSFIFLLVGLASCFFGWKNMIYSKKETN